MNHKINQQTKALHALYKQIAQH